MNKTNSQKNKLYELSDANQYIDQCVMTNDERLNDSMNRLAPGAKDLSGLQPDVVAGSANSPTARSNNNFISEIYSNSAKFLATGKDIFYAKFSVSRKGTADRNTMYVDIMLTPGDKPLKYVINMRSSRYAYEIKNSIKPNQADWSGWNKLMDMYEQFDIVHLGRLRNSSKNTSIVPRSIIPYCAGGCYVQDGEPHAFLQLQDNFITVPLDAIDPDVERKRAKYFMYGAEYRGTNTEISEYDLDELGL